MIQDIQKINDCVARIYEILEFAPEQIEELKGDLAKAQQAAAAAEMLKNLTQDELKSIDEAAQKSDEDKKAAIEQIVKLRAADKNLKQAAAIAAKKVLDEHIDYLKTQGDEAQKAEIAKILAEM